MAMRSESFLPGYQGAIREKKPMYRDLTAWMAVDKAHRSEQAKVKALRKSSQAPVSSRESSVQPLLKTTTEICVFDSVQIDRAQPVDALTATTLLTEPQPVITTFTFKPGSAKEANDIYKAEITRIQQELAALNANQELPYEKKRRLLNEKREDLHKTEKNRWEETGFYRNSLRGKRKKK